jgi:hypothetical protein
LYYSNGYHRDFFNPIVADNNVFPPTGGNVTDNDTLNVQRVTAATTDVTPAN